MAIGGMTRIWRQCMLAKRPIGGRKYHEGERSVPRDPDRPIFPDGNVGDAQVSRQISNYRRR